MKKRLAVLGAVMLALVISGCSSAEKMISKGVNDAAEKIGDAASDTGVASTEAYNNYVDLYNSMASGSLKRCIGYYFEGVQDTEEFEVVEGESYTSYGFSEYDYELIDNVEEQAKQGTGYEKLDAAAAAICPTARRLMELIDSAAAYGNQQGYADDDYAKAKEIHAEFYPLLKTYYTDASVFANELDIVAEKRSAKELEDLKNNGYEIRSSMLEMMNLAAKISSVLYADENITSANITELDVTNIKPLYNEFAKKIADFTELIKDESKIEEEGFDPTFNRVDDFADAAADFKVEVQKIIERVENNKPLSETDIQLGDLTDGSFEKFSKLYGNLIDRYNGM